MKHLYFLFATLLMTALLAPAKATTITVTNTNDSGSGSLRDAITTSVSGDTIRFASSLNSGTITLTSGSIDFAKTLTIIGPGYDLLTISGNNSSRIFNISGGDIEMIGLKLINARYSGSSLGWDGGAINHQPSGTLVMKSLYFLNDSVFNGDRGAAVFYGVGNGYVSADSCFFVHCAADYQGSAMSCWGGPVTTVVNACTFDGNRCLYGSGGCLLTGGNTTITNSTFCNNTSAGNTASVQLQGINSLATIENCTFSNNIADSPEYGIYGFGGFTLNMVNCTYANNNEPIGFYLMDPWDVLQFNTQNCIFNNTGSANLAYDQGMGTYNFTSYGGNISSDATMSFFLTNTFDMNNTNPMLSPLANNGGITPTCALLPGSPAIDNGVNTGVPLKDQIGHTRCGNTDAGALEYNYITETITDTECVSYLSPSGNHTWTNSGTYQDTIIIMGCATLYNVNLTIKPVNIGVYQLGTSLVSMATGAAWQWIDCNGNIPISGATGQSYTATADGDYAVVVTENDCSDTSTCYTISGIGVTEYDFDNKLVIYPNPANESITVVTSNPRSEIAILNMQGQIIRSIKANESLTTLDISALAKGMYFVKVLSENGIAVKKFVKE